jgi:hypothetical protein
MARALKIGRPLAFTFHHNSLDAYTSIAVAILDSGLTCSASLPSPAEMGGSIHINGTGSSIIDTIFVCRKTGRVSRRTLASAAAELGGIVKHDLDQLLEGGVKATLGDIRCIIAGHLTRLAIWNLRHHWRSDAPIARRLRMVTEWFAEFGGVNEVLSYATENTTLTDDLLTAKVCEDPPSIFPNESFVSF